MRKVLIFGGASAIATAAARAMARDGAGFFLVDLDQERLMAVRQDLLARGASKVEFATADLTVMRDHAGLIGSAGDALPDFDTVLIAYGYMGSQQACQEDFEAARKVFDVNFVRAASLLTLLANRFERQGFGAIAVITSPAGDRGRQSNYVYGAAKGALSVFVQGLRNRLQKSGVTVLTVKPGFVDTPMTADLKKGFLFSKPEVVGEGIYRAIKKGKDIVYLPWFWWPIMLIIKNIPEAVFKRMKL